MDDNYQEAVSKPGKMFEIIQQKLFIGCDPNGFSNGQKFPPFCWAPFGNWVSHRILRREDLHHMQPCHATPPESQKSSNQDLAFGASLETPPA
jgi:hypothetical protein